MIKLHIEDGAYWYNLPLKVQKKIEKDLTFKNPTYEKMIKQGKYINASIAPELYFFNCEGKNYYTPKGYIFFLKRFLDKQGVKVLINDKSALFNPLKLKFNGTLRDYQEQAVKDLTSYPVGMLQALTGGGKTFTSIGVIAKIKQPTLIIVHSKELLYQWRDEIKKVLDFDCGLLGDGCNDVQKITVGIINTVEKNIDKLHNKFGMIIVDEVHKTGGNRYYKTLPQFTAKYMYGVSATPYRQDGLTHVLSALFGNKIKIDEKHLRKKGYVLTPDIHRVYTNFHYMFTNDYTKMITALCEDENRNVLIARTIYADFKKHKQPIIVVSDRTKHLERIQEKLMMESSLLTGKTPKKERVEITRKLKNNECKVLFSTLSLIAEGFDAPNLSALFMGTPIKFAGRLLQSGGRILRPADGANPRVYDFRDNNVNVLKYSGYARDKVYSKEWGK